MSEERELTQEEKDKFAERHRELQLESIEIRSEEVQEIMGYIPNWIIRWGITLIFIVVVVFLIGSYFFKYPDVIMSSITVTTENPPAALVARASAKIGDLRVKDNQEVKAGEIIAILDTALDYAHLIELKERLAQLETMTVRYDPTKPLLAIRNYNLGELQSGYSSFLKTYSDYRYFIRLNYHQTKINSVNAQLARQRIIFEGIKRQITISEQEFQLSKTRFERNKELLKDNIISKNEFERAKTTFLQQQYSLEGARSTLSNQKIQLAQLEQNIEDLRLQYKEQKAQLELALDQTFNNLSGQISQWEQNYVLITPIPGSVTFTKYWNVNQNVVAGDTVVTIIPKNAGKLIGKVVLPIQGAGKVKIGQKVNIKFLSFPHVEYGMVFGVVKSKSMVAADKSYVVEVELPEGLNTSYGEELEFSQQMEGSAEIITEDIRLIGRIFKPIKSILERM